MRDDDFERRLDDLRGEAGRTGSVAGAGVRAAGGPLPTAAAGGGPGGAAGDPRPGYYGMPVLKPPVWTWEVPAYFFVGGLAGMAAVIGAAALLVGGRSELARAALWTAAAGAPVSAALLTADLGRPRRFLNMLRVFKWRSPMSVGAWILTGFGGAALTAAALAQWAPAVDAAGWRAASLAAALAAGLSGSLLATYTGVLLGATTIPAWHTHRALLPAHFGTAGLGSAAAFLLLLGFEPALLTLLGILAAAVETGVGALAELRRHGAADRALRTGRAGLLLRLSGAAAGPAALLLWLLGPPSWAAIAFLAGALGSRFGWIAAGRASGRDPEAAFSAAR